MKSNKIKVLHVISGDLWAGAEVQAFLLLKNIHKHTDLHVAVMNHGELSKRLTSCGIKVTVLNEDKNLALTLITRIRIILLEFQPDLIHTHRQKENILTSIANSLSIRAKSIRTQHGASEFQSNWKQKLIGFIDHKIGNYLQDGIIAVSDDLKLKLTQFFPSEKIYVIHNGVDLDELNKQATLLSVKKQNPSKIHIGFIGRLVPVKRLDIFLSIAKETTRARPDSFMFHIVGDGPLFNRIESQIHDLKLEDKIILHGFRKDVISYLYSMDILLITSDHEGMPMVLLEALALNKTVITRDIQPFNQFPEVHCIKDSSNIPLEISQFILKKSYSSQNIRKLDDKYHAQTMSKKTLDLYKNMVSSGE